MGILESIQSQAAVNPEYRQQAETLVTLWLQDAQAGSPPKLSKDVGEPETPLTVSEAQQLLNALQTQVAPPALAVAPTGSAAAAQAPNPFTVAAAGPLTYENPNNFPVLGGKTSDRSWGNLNLRLNYYDCGQRDCPLT